MGFNPVSGRANFLTVQNPDDYHQHSEEGLAVGRDEFAPDVQAEMEKLFCRDLSRYRAQVLGLNSAPTIQYPKLADNDAEFVLKAASHA
jgi:hypothetical protein